MDDHEDRGSFSKFAVKFNEQHFQRHSNKPRKIEYFNNMTLLNPEQTIIETSAVRKV